MEFPLLIALLQHSADGIGRGISVHNEGTCEIGVSEYGGGCDCVDQGIKCLLALRGPYKSSGLHAQCDECVQRCGNGAITADVHLVEITEAKE